jgi:hypothetical protein
MAEAQNYWKSLWGAKTQHNERAEWIRREKRREIINIVIIIILVITVMQGIYNYIPETNHVSWVYDVAAVLYLQSVKVQSNPITGLDRPRGFQEVEAPRFHDNRHMEVAPYAPAVFIPRKYSWYSFQLEAESAKGP